MRLLRLLYLVELGSDQGSLTYFAVRGGGLVCGSVVDLIFDLSLPKDWARL